MLALVRQGLTNDEIAHRLGISADGVKFHVSEILGKLGVSSRNEAARWYDGQVREPATACLRFGPRQQPRFARRTRLGRGSPRGHYVRTLRRVA